jgi:hypothetical protein
LVYISDKNPKKIDHAPYGFTQAGILLPGMRHSWRRLAGFWNPIWQMNKSGQKTWLRLCHKTDPALPQTPEAHREKHKPVHPGIPAGKGTGITSI